MKNAVKCLVLWVSLLGASTVWPQVREEWVARFHGSGNSEDSANAITVDGVGNVYVTGYSEGEGTDRDYVTVKYDPDGNQQWVARYNGPGNGPDYATAIARDSAGNLYVTGASLGDGTSFDYATVKYDSDGNQIWVARYNGPSNLADSANAVAVDNAGGVYVTGPSQAMGRQDYATVKYDSDGNELWVARYNGPGNGADTAFAMVLDSMANVYVTGQSLGTASRDSYAYATVKYDSNGNEQWVARYNGLADGYNIALAIGLDGAGNLYVTGESQGVGINFDYATVKYDSNGNQLWAARYHGPENGEEGAFAIAVDTDGNAYVTGMSHGTRPHYDYATVKYDSEGNEQWVTRYGGPDDRDNFAKSIALDTAASVYVTGYSRGAGRLSDYVTVKYDSAGNEQWVARYHNPASSGFDAAHAMALDAGGNVYVTGTSSNVDDSGDYATVKYVQK